MISRKKRKQRAPGASLCLLAPASAVCAGAVIYLKEIINIARFNRIEAGDFTILYLPPEPFSFFLRSLILILLVSATLGCIEAATLYGIRALERRFFRNLSERSLYVDQRFREKPGDSITTLPVIPASRRLEEIRAMIDGGTVVLMDDWESPLPERAIP